MEHDLVFFDKNLTPIIKKEEILSEEDNDHEVIKVYDFSKNNFNLFDPSKRKLIWEKEEDLNFKTYITKNLTILPKYPNGYNTIYESSINGVIYIKPRKKSGITIHKSELKCLIDCLTEINNFLNSN